MASDQVRARACDWLMLGPIVGFTDQHRSRILAQSDQAGPLELRIAEAAPGVSFDDEHQTFGPVAIVGKPWRMPPTRTGDLQTVMFELDGLTPDTRYFYEVVPVDAPARVADHFVSTGPFSFRTLPKVPCPLNFSFHSCNGLHKPPRGGRPTTMWARLLREAVEDRGLHFAIFGGDQIYADVIREEWQREWEPDFDPYAKRVFDSVDARRCRAFFEDLPRRYEQIYRAFWRRPEIRTFMGHMPCVMTWDDHDIYDGWGSHGDESLPAQQKFFEAAARTFDAFQFPLAPPDALSPAGAVLREDHRGFSFLLGDIGFIVLDVRSCRDVNSRGPSAVLGIKQWAWLEAELQELATRSPRQLVVVSAVPVVHMGSGAELLIPGMAELHDDVLDHWNSRTNRNDQARLLGRLFQFRKQTGANVLLLGGDVHVGTVGEVVSEDRRFLLDGEPRARIHQGVSSSIAHGPVTGLSADVVRWLCQREHPLRGSFVGRIDEVVSERNFAVISARDNQAFRFTLFNERSAVPDQFYFGRSGG